DWNEPATSIERKIRAFDPWPGAFAVLRGADGRERKLKIHRASVTDSCSTDPVNLVIPTKSGALRLEEVQLEGKRRMSAAEFLRGQQGPVRVE
ncbi:MAG: methionyl-tRNA formyltransferase, partial [Verrucomicrobiota bacterium]